jgi:putative Holliday junction resolvase
MTVTRLLGIDLGDRRIGIAIGDDASGVVRPLATLRRRTPADDAATIDRICREHGAVGIVVGLPLHADGSESEQASRTRDWATVVQPLLGLPMSFRDEWLTSQAAESRLGAAPRSRGGGPPSPPARHARRARIDREAAALIVQAEIDARAADDRATVEHAPAPGGVRP